MKERIEKVNQAIEEKRERLKEKAKRHFSAIVLPSYLPVGHEVPSTSQSLPPISYILYGIAGLAALGVFLSDSKILCASLTAISAYGGYRFSNPNKAASVSLSSSANLNSLKNEVESKVLGIIKNTTHEWEEFMERKQQEVQQIISTVSSSQKDAMMSKVVLYEVIDIRVSEFSSMIMGVSSISELKNKIEAYKLKLLKAIDEASAKQIEKYNSICE